MTLSYVYGLTIRGERGERELLAFHWHRDQPATSVIPNGHVHIGAELLAARTVVRPGDFHTAHIPTDYVSFAAVVRFAIAELGARPLMDRWREILSVADAVSRRTRST